MSIATQDDFTVGQRWVVDSEPELGLGLVVGKEGRHVTMYFPAQEIERVYAKKDAPLSRIRFSSGEVIHDINGDSFSVADLDTVDGLYAYTTECGKVVMETSLSGQIQLNQAFMRLVMGQIDHPNWFKFKRLVDKKLASIEQKNVKGLIGVRGTLTPHQLYVAKAACELNPVRVLLADEVGLGKTIEAGLILSRLLMQERATRVAIMVPDALQVQWLVEMVRKFSIAPVIYSDAIEDLYDNQVYIFTHAQLIEEADTIISGNFDTVIVDEAHHIDTASDAFLTLSQLSSEAKHCILLTATPEQFGRENHFARLQLLDREKFNNYEEFKQQESRFSELNTLIKELPESSKVLRKKFGFDDAESDEAMVESLLDIYGVGRMVFRNRRLHTPGFPVRKSVRHDIDDNAWETRFDWLGKFAKKNKDEKILVICHEMDKVLKCENRLWRKHGVDAAIFHEEQDLIERDRAAAYFADNEEGANLLVCSEIGSEGRNFQFCHHLVCLDLPDRPDLLEQRIGRLDRIGQTSDVNIHFPIALDSDEALLFNWYHDVLHCIERLNPAAGMAHKKYWPAAVKEDQSLDMAVVAKAREFAEALQADLEQGRDALLELNSCRQPEAGELVETIQEIEADTPKEIVDLASELLQFHFEETSAGAYSLIPSDKMLIPALPGIPPEGAEVTFDRGLACSREELLFLSWDSPFITGLWELVRFSELGSASVATLKNRQLPAGHCLVEADFDVLIEAQDHTRLATFMPQNSVRVVVLDSSDKNLASVLPEQSVEKSLGPIQKRLARQVIKSRKEEIGHWYKKAEAMAEAEFDGLKAAALNNLNEHCKRERDRLSRLKMAHQQSELGADLETVLAAIDEFEALMTENLSKSCHLRISALRLIVIAP